VFGTAVLIVAAPALAEIALKFSSFEYFWLVMLGLMSAVFLAHADPLKGIVSLLAGLLVASVGLDNPAGFPRFTFGNAELAGGLTLIPIMIGMFALSEIIRGVASIDRPWEMAQAQIDNVLRGMWGLAKRYPAPILRGSVLGTAIGALPGAGADIAAWMSYAVSKKFSRERDKFGTGHVEGIIEAGASNNSALAGAWIPALVFGIPGDSITAIVIGVLYIKGLNPGPTIFMNNAPAIYAIFIVFILANLLMVPLGIAAIKGAKQMLRAPRAVLLPVILLFCVVGSFAINNSIFGVVLMLAFGLVAYLMEENGFPVAPAILGMVLGAMLEENFISSMIKADGNFIAFFERPIAGGLGAFTLAVVSVPLLQRVFRAAR
jgi:TctA family transporter